MGMVSGWLSDLRHGARSLGRTPGFTVTAVGMLGLAIGATAGLFSVVDKVLLDPLPYAHPDRLIRLTATAPGSQFPEEFGLAPEFYLHFKERARTIEDVATYNSFTNTLRVADRAERIRMSMPSTTLFSTLGAVPVLGRLPTPADEDRAIVISDTLWANWFGRDPGVIGKVVQAGGGDRTVIGVLGPDFRFPTDDTLLWISYTLKPTDITEPGDFGTPLIARMAPGQTFATVAAELDALAKELPARYGGPPAYARTISQYRTIVKSLEETLLGNVSGPLWVLLGAAGIVLLIACANVANLFLVRSEAKHRELALRRALGAGRRQLVTLQMAEAALIAGAAAVVAVMLAVAALPLFLQVAPPRIPRLDQVGIGVSTLVFTLGIAIVAALLCGGLPAARGASPDLTRLRDGGRGTTTGHHWVRNGLVIGQTALALVLLIGSGLLLRSAWELRQVNPGYDPTDIFTFQIAPERASLQDQPSFARFYLDFAARLAAMPEVQSVGIIENMPLDEGTAAQRVLTEYMGGDISEGALANYTYTAGNYFQTMRIPLLSGRTFNDQDQSTSLGNVIVSRAMARQLWPDRDAVGQRIKRDGSDTWETVVGVVEDVMQDNLTTPAQATMYFPLVGPTPEIGRPISSPAFVIRTARAETIAPDVRALVREVAPEAPMYRIYTLEGLVDTSMQQLSFTLLTMGIAAVLALILGAVGLYGTLSYVVAERTREIGVRMALGAQARQVRSMVVKQGARLVGAGVLLGIVVALVFTRSLGQLLFGVAAMDAATFIAMSLAMASVGLLASYVPARRASNLDPIESLRRD